jgi:hypothetical protein
MPGWFGRGIEAGEGRAAPPPETPNGLLPGPRAGGRGEPPPGPGRGPPGAPGPPGRPAAGEPGRGGTLPGPGRGPGPRWAPPSVVPCGRRSASRERAACAACAALTAASCSAFSAEARASAAATSMSCALAGFATGPGVGPGRPGTGGFGRTNGPGVGAAGDVGLLLGPPCGAPGRRGGWGRPIGGPGRGDAEVLGPPGAAGAPDAGAGEDAGMAPPCSRAPRSRRATGASTVLDADLTNSPMSFNVARTVLLSTPSSLASSCTRALPGTALLTSRSYEQRPHRPHSCTRSLVISGTSSCAHLGRPTLLDRDGAPAPRHRWFRTARRPCGCAPQAVLG